MHWSQQEVKISLLNGLHKLLNSPTYLKDKLSPVTSCSLDQKKKKHKEVVAKNGPEKKIYLTDCSFDKAKSIVLSGERYPSLLQTE